MLKQYKSKRIMKKNPLYWLLLTGLIVCLPSAFVSCDNNDNPTPVVEKPAWYIYLDSAQVRESRGLANASFYAANTYRLEHNDTAVRVPDNLRSSDDAFDEKYRSRQIEADKGFTPTRDGMENLHISGSTSISYKQLDALTDWLKAKAGGKKIFILDLRSEYNIYVNGHLINYYGFNNWANIGRKRDDIIAGERTFAESLVGKRISTGTISAETEYQIVDTMWVDVTECLTEEQAVKKMAAAKGVDMEPYRITPIDHCFPVDGVIDDFLEFYRSVPKDAWVHMHCYAGRGRTTLFMSFFDMLRNPNVPLRDIINRQVLIGGVNLYYVVKEGDKAWRIPLFTEIDRMMSLLKLYVDENASNGYTRSWSDWKATKR